MGQLAHMLLLWLDRGKAYRWGGRSKEDEGTKVGGALVGEGAGGVDESAYTIGLDTRADNGASPRGGGGGSLLGVEVLLLGVCLLCAAVGIAKDGAKNGEGDGVVEGSAEGDGRGLDGREVYERRAVSEVSVSQLRLVWRNRLVPCRDVQ